MKRWVIQLDLREGAILLAVAFCFFFYRPHGSPTGTAEYWHTQWATTLMLSSGFLALVIRVRFGWLAALAFASTVLSSLYAIDLSSYVRIQAAAGTLVSVEGIVGTGLVCFLIYSFLFAALTEEGLATVEKLFSYFALLASLQVLFEFIKGDRGHMVGGFCAQAGMAGSFLATLYPLTLKHTGLWSYLILVAVLILAYSLATMPLLVLLTVGLVGLAFYYPKKVFSFAVVSFLIFRLLHLYVNPHLFDSSGRFQFYGIIAKYFVTHAPLTTWLFGTGNSTFLFLGQKIQDQANFMPGHAWAWLHSDWGQLLFEQGLVGFLLFAALFVQCLRRAYRARRFDLVSSLCGYSVMALFNYPARLAAHAALGVFLVAYSLRLQPLQGRLS